MVSEWFLGADRRFKARPRFYEVSQSDIFVVIVFTLLEAVLFFVTMNLKHAYEMPLRTVSKCLRFNFFIEKSKVLPLHHLIGL